MVAVTNLLGARTPTPGPKDPAKKNQRHEPAQPTAVSKRRQYNQDEHKRQVGSNYREKKSSPTQRIS